jgi:pyruvate formate-lyase activating enzyme-like uncharacterized protein
MNIYPTYLCVNLFKDIFQYNARLKKMLQFTDHENKKL